ncbi:MULTISPECIES: hypothetical protein [Klebsiella]|jgi:hypothetical protein|nr:MULTISPECIES: hypothetical protein [Klebsiella]DAY60340.1 MAG TPA: hypothetical protein [Caudoviricetes sp.]HBS0594210.1 hypothetical protein [Klebsiella quasipneumoniae subsp. quasipneumoniae]HEP0954595.1 hypothetical protein [Klebsiella pneumoniae subsp. ozaenae]AMA31756.1 hypothetical protein RJF9_20445 [Klebsiella pneumoniae subsp. pneumoniae]ASG57256.1 hypothetical protein CEV20_02185 [Klebsiella pneumoniae]
MLESYFDQVAKDHAEAIKLNQRLLAVQAALEIAKASVSSTTAMGGVKSGYDLENVTKKIGALADAIQSALEK